MQGRQNKYTIISGIIKSYKLANENINIYIFKKSK